MNLAALLDSYEPADAAELEYLERMRALADVGPVALRRDHLDPGHFTASALVLSPNRCKVALVWHPKLARWLQPGGHLEPEDASPLEAARREVAEELGIDDLEQVGEGIFDIDIHDIPARPREGAHQHFDLRFAFVAPHTRTRGELEARWVHLHEVSEVESDASVMRAVSRLRARLNQPMPPAEVPEDQDAYAALVARFEDQRLPFQVWRHHRTHLIVATWYLAQHGEAGALERIRAGILAMLEANGVRNTPTNGYHETLTRAWLSLVAAQLARSPDLPPPALARRVLEGLADQNVLLRYYSEARLLSPEARAGWVEPDLAPLP